MDKIELDPQSPDFQAIIAMLSRLSGSAQMTFMYQYISTLCPSQCRSVIRYSCIRLDKINELLPDGNLFKERSRQLQAERQEQKRLQMQTESGAYQKSFVQLQNGILGHN